jgi:hypothetical protein
MCAPFNLVILYRTQPSPELLRKLCLTIFQGYRAFDAAQATITLHSHNKFNDYYDSIINSLLILNKRQLQPAIQGLTSVPQLKAYTVCKT